MSLRTISYKRRHSEGLPKNALQISWICQNLVENRIGSSVYDTLTTLLGIDYTVTRRYTLEHIQHGKESMVDVTANLKIQNDCISIERLSEYHIVQQDEDYEPILTIPLHVKTTSRFFIESEEEEIRIEMMFGHDCKEEKKMEKKQHTDWFDCTKLKADVRLTLHSTRSSIPKSELLRIHQDALGRKGSIRHMMESLEKHRSL